MKNKFFKAITLLSLTTLFACTSLTMAAETPEEGKESAVEIAAPVSVKITSSNEVLSITLPDASWKEVNNDEDCITFSNGTDIITFDHFTTDGEMPKFQFSEKEDEYFCQSLESHNGVVLYFTGYAETKEDFEAVEQAIASVEIDVEKIEDEIHQAKTEEYSIVPEDYTAYVNAISLRVRPTSDTAQEPIGTLQYGDPIHVTGTVFHKGTANGWLRISFNNTTGYVNGDFITKEKPQTQPVIQKTYTAYRTSDNHSVSISLYSDGSYKDASGNRYYLIANETWNDGLGNTYSTTPVAPSIVKVLTVYAHNGSSKDLFFYSDNTITDGYGDSYYMQDSEVYINNRTGEAFKTTREEEPQILEVICITDEAEEIHTEIYLYSNGTYRDNNGDFYTEFEHSYTNQRTGEVFYYDTERNNM